MSRLLALLSLLLTLGACETTGQAADTAAEGAEDVADATVSVARDAADAVDTGVDVASGAVTDAAGTVYRSARDLFTDDPEAMAVALVRPTSAAGAQAQGTVRFRQDGGGLRVSMSLQGLDPGRHGVHVHMTPSCAQGDADGDGMMEPAGAAGGHWDPLNTNDHGAATEDLDDKHLGDLGNVTVGADGTVETTVTVANFPADRSVAGRALIVHSQADDRESDPGGESGTRVGCGVIEARM